MRTPGAIALLSLALGAGGCTTSRNVAPWARISEYAPFEIMAESGRGPHGHRAWAERKVGDDWVVVPDAPASAFAFADDTRVVLGDDLLLTRDGRTTRLPCPHSGNIGDGLRAMRRTGLVCVVTRGAFGSAVAADDRETVTVIRLGDDGRERTRLRVASPVLRPADALALSIDVDTSFVGFLADELVFAVLVTRRDGSWASDAWKTADGWALAPDGRWRKLGSMRFQAGSVWKLHAAGCWASALGLPVDAGLYAQGADGRPDWSRCS